MHFLFFKKETTCLFAFVKFFQSGLCFNDYYTCIELINTYLEDFFFPIVIINR